MLRHPDDLRHRSFVGFLFVHRLPHFIRLANQWYKNSVSEKFCKTGPCEIGECPHHRELDFHRLGEESNERFAYICNFVKGGLDCLAELDERLDKHEPFFTLTI